MLYLLLLDLRAERFKSHANNGFCAELSKQTQQPLDIACDTRY